MTWSDPGPGNPASVAGRPGAVGGYGADGTGNAEVDAVVAGLVDLASLPLTDQVTRYTEAHRSLQQTLRTIDET